MSARTRDTHRSPFDFYPTPTWCVQRLVEAVDLPGGRWLEPAAGDGAIIRAIGRFDVKWTAWEVREDEGPRLRHLDARPHVVIGDFLGSCATDSASTAKCQVAITNPPFSLAMPFIEGCLAQAEIVVMLLPLNFLASEGRWKFMRANTPDVYVLPNRASFKGGNTDIAEYGWFVWRGGRRSAGKIRVLGLTSPTDRGRCRRVGNFPMAPRQASRSRNGRPGSQFR